MKQEQIIYHLNYIVHPLISNNIVEMNKNIQKLIFISFLIMFVLSASLTVTPETTLINQQTNYVWDIVFNNAGPRSFIILHFVSEVVLQTPLTVKKPDNTQIAPINLSTTNRQINITLDSNLQSNLSLILTVGLIKNGFRQNNIFPYVTSSISNERIDYPNGITFTPGDITNCDISFEGQTWQNSSTAYINFTVSNSINAGTVQFKVSHGLSYSSSTLKISQNGLSCSFSTNGGSFGDVVEAIQNTLNFKCTFPGKSIQQGDKISLKILNVINPPTTTSYDSFGIETYDDTYLYDQISQCANTQVKLAQFVGTFDKVIKINQPYSNAKIATSLTPPIKVGNTMEISFAGIIISGCSPNSILSFFRISTLGSNFIIVQKTDILLSTRNQRENTNTGTTTLQMNTCTINMPSSQTRIPITFTFKINSLSAMAVVANLAPEAVFFSISDISLTIPDQQIGNQTEYKFTINISEKLSSSASIFIDMPSEVGLQNFVNNQCLVTTILDTLKILTTQCGIFSQINKIINVTFTANTTISAQILTVIINNIVNPVVPQSYSSFGVQTYYSSLDATSKVQKGASLTSGAFTRRLTTLTLASTQIYAVNQNPRQFILQYTNVVPLPLGGRIELQFLDSLNFTEVLYDSATINDTSYTFNFNRLESNQTFSLKHTSSIAKNSVIKIKFKFRVPKAIGSYNILNLKAQSSTFVLYEQSKSPLVLEVANAAYQNFIISPVNKITGATTSYEVSFFTNVAHTFPFTLQITLPTNVVLDGINSCIGTCDFNIQSSIVDIQTTLIATIRNSSSNSYLLSISGLKNPRSIGNTGSFTFKTFQGISQILTGSAITSITLPNLLTASFASNSIYYRNSVQQVKILYSPTNNLISGDYLLFNFDYRTYKRNTPNQIACTYAKCQSLTQSSSITIIKATLEAPVNKGQTGQLYISGLKAYGLIISGITYNVRISSYSSDGAKIDQGEFPYSLTCNYATIASKNCKTCNNVTNKCITCYNQEGFSLFDNDYCTNNCGNVSLYQTYPNSNTCVSCYTLLSLCETCITQNQCLTCRTGWLYEDQTCKSFCNATNHYSTTIGSQKSCLTCWDDNCGVCINGTSKGCTSCTVGFLELGQCLDQCPGDSYISGSKCSPCNVSCNGCTGSDNDKCKDCKTGYFNISGRCLKGCPAGSVIIGTTCDCNSPCSTCSTVATFCLTCLNQSNFVYNGQCLETCPNSSYNNGNKQCIDCNSGCQACTKTSCLTCLERYNVYQNKCYTQCNDVGDRYSGVDGRCIQCPQGCDVCNATYHCSICLANYTLQNTQCKLTCQINNDCQPVSPVPDNVIPLPGLIATSVWLGVVILLKLVFIKILYVPYSFITLGSIIEYILIIILIAKQNNTIQQILSQITTNRLLQTTGALIENYQYSVLGLLATTIAFNYITNIIYLIFFCKYMKKFIPDRQIDKISNYLVIVIGTVTNYRFTLLAYSKMFPKPKIDVQNASNLTPLHYLCISSIFVSIIPMIAAGILVYNQYPLTDLFMLGIDILLIVVLNLLFSIWMVSIEKPDEYFESTKKYTLEEHYRTQQNINQKDFKNISKSNLMPNNNVINVIDLNQQDINEEDYNPNYYMNQKHLKISKATNYHGNQKSDIENQPLPNIPIRSSNVNLQTTKIQPKETIITDEDDMHQFNQQDSMPVYRDLKRSEVQPNFENSQVTKRKAKNRNTVMQRNKPKQQQQTKQGEIQNGIKSKIKESTRNYSKQKDKNSLKKSQSSQKSQSSRKIQKQKSMKLGVKKQKQFKSQEIQQEDASQSQSNMTKKNSQTLTKPKKLNKPDTQRSAAVLGDHKPMKKKQNYGVFESQQNGSIIDQIDFESIIQSKMIDKTQQKNKKNKNQIKTELDKQEDNQFEEISPSWFNIPNQRYDVNDDDSSEP